MFSLLMRSVKGWSQDVSGNTLMAFAFAVPMLFGTAGLAVDFSRIQAAKVSAQSTMDAALLAASRSTTLNDSVVDGIVQSYFSAPGVMKYDAYFTSLQGVVVNGETIRAEGLLRVPTTLLSVIGHRHMEAKVAARVTRGLGNVEIALVLDTTYSMSAESRMENMKTAAIGLIDTVYALPDASNKIKVSLVPFAKYVNVGMENRNASWMDVPADTVTTITPVSPNCPLTYPNATVIEGSCRMVTPVYDGVEGTPYETCDYNYGTPVEVCTPYTNTWTWNGCAGPRPNPLNIKDAQYSTRIPGVMGVSCPSKLRPLTNDPTEIKDAINAMTPNDNTYIPTGLTWGWRMLSNREPFTESADDPSTQSGNVRKYLVLMTDGANQASVRHTEVDHEGGDITAANTLTVEACQEIRGDTQSKIEIFTIAFKVPDDAAGLAIKQILQNCATPGGAFYDAVDADRLFTAFTEIGSSVSTARIER